VSDEPTTELPPGVGPELPDLEPLRKIGQGGYGEVWLARNRVTGRLFAVKAVPLHPADGRDRAAREIASVIRHEASFRNRHENLLAIHHVGQTEEVFYYVMDPADDARGRPASADPAYRPSTLTGLLGDGPLPPERCFELARQLLAGLAGLHEAQLAHRDVKPSNCLFVEGKLKLADFGLLTRTEGSISLVGTPGYMPPDKRMDARADVYAAGLVIYEMLTGLPAREFPRLPGEALAGADASFEALNRLVLRACQADPDRRYGDAREMLRSGEAFRARARRRATRTGRRIALGAAALIAIAAAAWAGWQMLAPRGVDVNFITVPYEAEIYLDGEPAVDDRGRAYRTPCTIPRLPERVHHVAFKLPGRRDLVAGNVDFATQREVSVSWESDANGPAP
jgi:hypothetical protein